MGTIKLDLLPIRAIIQLEGERKPNEWLRALFPASPTGPNKKREMREKEMLYKVVIYVDYDGVKKVGHIPQKKAK